VFTDEQYEGLRKVAGTNPFDDTEEAPEGDPDRLSDGYKFTNNPGGVVALLNKAFKQYDDDGKLKKNDVNSAWCKRYSPFNGEILLPGEIACGVFTISLFS